MADDERSAYPIGSGCLENLDNQVVAIFDHYFYTYVLKSLYDKERSLIQQLSHLYKAFNKRSNASARICQVNLVMALGISVARKQMELNFQIDPVALHV